MNRLIIIFSICLLSCQESKVPATCSRAIGNLFVSDIEMEMGTASLNKAYKKTIQVYNPTRQDISLRVLNERPEINVTRNENGKEVSAKEAFILPSRGLDSLTIQFYGQDTSLYGEYFEAIHLEVDGKTLITGIPIGGVIIDNFEYTSLEESPRIMLDKDSVTFHFQQDSIPREMFISITISNNGITPLIIRKVEATCNCAKPILEKYAIPAHEKTTLHIKFKPKMAIGTVAQEVRLISNDPTCPIKLISVKTIVKP